MQLKHACAPAEQLLRQVRAAEQAAAAREARLEERACEQAELAARQATQALQALRAQLTAAHAEALLEVSCHHALDRPRLPVVTSVRARPYVDGDQRSSCLSKVRGKYEEERATLSSRLAFAEAKAQQLTRVEADLAAAREECAALKVPLLARHLTAAIASGTSMC